VLIIASSYLFLLDESGGRIQGRLALLIALALGSNIVVGRLPDRWMGSPLFDFGIVLFDAAWVTLGLLWAPAVSGDLFLLYFLVIFVAAMGESLPMIVGSAVLVSLVYGASLSWHPGGDFRLTTTALLKVPFLFVVALFYGYFVTEIRGRRKEADEARLHEQAKTELLAAVSHDLRGPLGNAENLLTLALQADPQPAGSQHELMLRAYVNVRRVNTLVSNLLEVACIQSGQVHFQWAPVQLNDLVDDVYNLEAGAAVLKGVKLSSETRAGLPVITADQVQVGRILTNLVNNAIKYTPPGGTVVLRTDYDDDTVRVSVHDTGPGMSPEQCAALFAPYRRVHVGGYTPGAGLGLYIAKRLTESQGGAIKVSSQQGAGSIFVMSLPRARRVGDTAARVTRAKERQPTAEGMHATSVSVQAA
jgi:signal transduction histidine kinase